MKSKVKQHDIVKFSGDNFEYVVLDVREEPYMDYAIVRRLNRKGEYNPNGELFVNHQLEKNSFTITGKMKIKAYRVDCTPR